MNAIRRVGFVLRLLLTAMTSHWRELLGVVFVAGLVGGFVLLGSEYCTAGLISVVFFGSASFLGMFDFDHMRKGIIWAAAQTMFILFAVLAYRSDQFGPVYMMVMCSMGLLAHVVRDLMKWSKVYRRQHAAPDEIQIIEFRDDTGKGIDWME
jgi:hypothetical protein